jgi:hypothetical protein
VQAYFAYGGAQTISMNPADDGSGSSVGAEVSTALAVTRKQTQTWTVARSTDIADTYVPVCQTPTLYIKNNITYWPSGFEPLVCAAQHACHIHAPAWVGTDRQPAMCACRATLLPW